MLHPKPAVASTDSDVRSASVSGDSREPPAAQKRPSKALTRPFTAAPPDSDAAPVRGFRVRQQRRMLRFGFAVAIEALNPRTDAADIVPGRTADAGPYNRGDIDSVYAEAKHPIPTVVQSGRNFTRVGLGPQVQGFDPEP